MTDDSGPTAGLRGSPHRGHIGTFAQELGCGARQSKPPKALYYLSDLAPRLPADPEGGVPEHVQLVYLVLVAVVGRPKRPRILTPQLGPSSWLMGFSQLSSVFKENLCAFDLPGRTVLWRSLGACRSLRRVRSCGLRRNHRDPGQCWLLGPGQHSDCIAVGRRRGASSPEGK